MDNLYDGPELYHHALDFRNIPAEVDTLVEASNRHGIGGRSVLEVACGNAPY
jgi:hypothetical protein